MPTVSFDITDQVANYIDTQIKSGGPGDFNAGQQAAWAEVSCYITSATLDVSIRGRDVEVSTNVSVECTGAPYISQAVASLNESFGTITQNIETGKSEFAQYYIEQAFKSL